MDYDREEHMDKNEGFTYPCYRDLKSNLGRLDSIVECNELAVRRLIRAVSCSKQSDVYINKISKKYEIKVNTVEIPSMQTHVAQLYGVTVYQQIEEFFEKCRQEHPRSSEWVYSTGMIRILYI